MKTIKCLVIDDEELARGLLISYIDKVDHLELVADFESPIPAMQIIKESAIDVIFLDIQMPDLKGTEFAKMIDPKTKVIFTTAYSKYALEGFDLNALDYLVKPITFERFLSAVEKFPLQATEKTDHLIVKSGYDLHKLLYYDIVYIESDSEYVIYHTEDGKKLMANQSLTKLEKILPALLFMRVHRSFIVNKQKVTGLKSRDLLLSGNKIPVSDSYYDIVKKELF